MVRVTKEQLRSVVEELPPTYCAFAQAAVEEAEARGMRDELAAFLKDNPHASTGRLLGYVAAHALA